MWNKLLLLLWVQLIYSQLIAQEPGKERIYARFGGNLFTSWSGSEKPFVMGTFNFSPGFRLINGRDVSATVTWSLSAGGAFREVGNSYFGLDVPAMFELHFGSATGNNQRNRFGFMMGAGAGYIVTAIEEEYTGRARSIDFWGLRFHTGLSLGRIESVGRGMLIASFGKNITGSTKYTIGLGFAVIMEGD